ncbi:MAG: sodium:solute symporter family protein [Saprospiraceae bacterium]
MLALFIFAYLGLTLLIGWRASRRVKTSADFVVAGRKLPLFMAATALFATWFGSETVMGATAEFAEHGLIGVIEDPFGAALCLFLCGVLIARPLYKRNLLTFSDFFRQRFGRSAEVVSAIFMAPSYFSWIAAQLVALSILLHMVSGVPREWGVVICAGLVLFYTYIGGMWSVSVTDFVQTIVIVVGLGTLAIDLTIQAGGPLALAEAAPDGYFQFLPDATPTDVTLWLAAWMTIGLGSIPQQDVFQRVMAARDEKTAVRACYVSALMYLSVAALPLLISYCGRILYPELLAEDAQMLLPNMVLRHSGPGIQILFFGALLSAILSTCSGAMLAPATVIGENLLKPAFRNLSDAQMLQLLRWSVVLVAVITAAMAMVRGNIYELVGESSALSLVSLFVPLIGGLYWKKANATGAVASMIAGMTVWAICQLALSATPAVGAGYFWHVPAMLYGLAASVLAMFIGSWTNRTKR